MAVLDSDRLFPVWEDIPEEFKIEAFSEGLNHLIANFP